VTPFSESTRVCCGIWYPTLDPQEYVPQRMLSEVKRVACGFDFFLCEMDGSLRRAIYCGRQEKSIKCSFLDKLLADTQQITNRAHSAERKA
jgi:hypothetical protein